MVGRLAPMSDQRVARVEARFHPLPIGNCELLTLYPFLCGGDGLGCALAVGVGLWCGVTTGIGLAFDPGLGAVTVATHGQIANPASKGAERYFFHTV